MFPPAFVRAQLLKYTRPGDLVLDPFSGRGTTLLESLILGREAIAIDINPVAACLTGAKSRVPDLRQIEERLDFLEAEFEEYDQGELSAESDTLPAFFKRAFYYTTLRQILFLRRRLSWWENYLDRFISALILGSLHGEMDRSPSYFSNQMPRTISLKPAYSLRYWSKHRLWPKKRRTFVLLRGRARLRLSSGRPRGWGLSVMTDVRLASHVLPGYYGKVAAVITSPPYLDVTRYEEDQWLRLWYLGGSPRPTYNHVSRDDRHTSARAYWRFLAESWRGVAPLLAPGATIVCRIGGKGVKTDMVVRRLMETVRGAFPNAYLVGDPQRSSPVKRQTDAFRPGAERGRLEADCVVRTA